MCNYFKHLVLIIIFSGLVASSKAEEANILHHSSNDFGSVWIFERQFENHKERCLSFIPPGNLMQSCMVPAKPNWVLFDYAQMMASSVFFHDNPRKILMIGMGGATIPKAINIILPMAELDIVEINPKLPVLAEEFFAFTPKAGTKIYVEDGVDFVKKAAPKTYDIILLDAFNKDYIPPAMLTREFALGIKKMLKQGGILSVNTLTQNSLHDQETKLFTEAFGEIYSVIMQGNRVIFAKNGTLPDIKEIEQYSVLWRFRLAEIGISQFRMVEFLKNTVKYRN